MEVFSMKPVAGPRPFLKTDLGINSMSHLMSHIYAFESALFAVAGKRPWSSETLKSETLALKILANQSLEWYLELINPMGRTGLTKPWSTYKRQLRHLAAGKSEKS